MPLSSRARIEIYLPDVTRKVYRNARRAFEREFLETFGGCTVIKGIKGLYLSAEGKTETDKVVLIYADTPFGFDENFDAIAEYADHLRDAALQVTNEEAVLVAVHAIYHAA